MDWELLLLMTPLAAFLWWAGFVATKRMRLGKNREREELAKRLLAEKAAHEAKERAEGSAPTESKAAKQEAS
ncbi:MAG: hypothetical protein GQ467_00475 [Mariprofundaceae bacterium]|nr:hypothetical protein [Mariprofundaceae bacterium]